MDLNKLKKLASVCRKAGIKSYKDSEFEFTLSDEVPPTRKRTASPLLGRQLSPDTDGESTDGMSDQDLLFWSAHPPLPDQAEDEVA